MSGINFEDPIIKARFAEQGITAAPGTPQWNNQLQAFNRTQIPAQSSGVWQGQSVGGDFVNPSFNPTQNDNGYTRFDQTRYGSGLERLERYDQAPALWEKYSKLQPGQPGYDHFIGAQGKLQGNFGVSDWTKATDQQLFEAFDLEFRGLQEDNQKSNKFGIGNILGPLATIGASFIPGIGPIAAGAIGGGIGGLAGGGGIGDILKGAGFGGLGGAAIPVPGSNGNQTFSTGNLGNVFGGGGGGTGAGELTPPRVTTSGERVPRDVPDEDLIRNGFGEIVNYYISTLDGGGSGGGGSRTGNDRIPAGGSVPVGGNVPAPTPDAPPSGGGNDGLAALFGILGGLGGGGDGGSGSGSGAGTGSGSGNGSGPQLAAAVAGAPSESDVFNVLGVNQGPRAKNDLNKHIRRRQRQSNGDESLARVAQLYPALGKAFNL